MIKEILSIQETNSSKERLNILKNLSNKYKNDDLFTKLIVYTYDKANIIFNVNLTKKDKLKILNRIKNNNSYGDIKNVINLVEIILKDVKSRKTWNEFVEKYLFNGTISKPEVEVLFLILKRNLGVGYERIVKYIKPNIDKDLFSFKIILPYFPFSLAESQKKINKLLDNNFDYKPNYLYAQPKYDGFRAVFNKDGDIYTRNNEIINVSNRPYLNKLKEEILILYAELDKIGFNNILFDGEIFYKSFEDTMSLASREEIKEDKPLDEYGDKLAFYIFDYVNKDRFENYNFSMKAITDELQKERIEFINNKVKKIIEEKKLKQIKIVNTFKINADFEEIKNMTEMFVNTGYEGSIIKHPDLYYFEGRDLHWIKFKPIKEIEGVIVDIKEGDGKFVNQAGSLVVKLPNGKLTSVGNLTKQQRENIWKNKDKYIGMIVDIQYQEITPEGVLRFPRIIRFREDKTIDNWNKEENENIADEKIYEEAVKGAIQFWRMKNGY